MILTDGGVYDNMSTEWPLFLATRVRLGAAPEPPPHPVDDVVFVNSSPGMSAKPRRSLTMPLLGEITSLLAAKDILYEQTIVPRRRMIVSYLRAAEAGFGGLAGCMVQVDFSPYDLPRAFASGSDDRAQRAKAALALLTAGEEAAWKADSEANSKVRTALSKIPAERAARLMRHSYVLTMVNMHVTRDYPLLPIPSVADFEKLVV